MFQCTTCGHVDWSRVDPYPNHKTPKERIRSRGDFWERHRRLWDRPGFRYRFTQEAKRAARDAKLNLWFWEGEVA